MTVKHLPVTWRHEGALMNLPGSLDWDASDPITLRLIITDYKEDVVEWFIGRDLIADALRNSKAGIGDVEIEVTQLSDTAWPPHAYPGIVFTLSNSHSTAQISTALAPVISFITQTYMEVPEGTEDTTDAVDQFIEGILNS